MRLNLRSDRHEFHVQGDKRCLQRQHGLDSPLNGGRESALDALLPVGRLRASVPARVVIAAIAALATSAGQSDGTKARPSISESRTGVSLRLPSPGRPMPWRPNGRARRPSGTARFLHIPAHRQPAEAVGLLKRLEAVDRGAHPGGIVLAERDQFGHREVVPCVDEPLSCLNAGESAASGFWPRMRRFRTRRGLLKMVAKTNWSQFGLKVGFDLAALAFRAACLLRYGRVRRSCSVRGSNLRACS